ncbi:MAG: hypothetical protein J1E62_07810 [Lachnospiraceae bacterium]|nr:hypothetical protein [Lachnospiraceae bacterium]
MSVEYGWLGQLNKKNSINLQRGSGTNTSSLIKKSLAAKGVNGYTAENIRSKNLVKDAKDNTVYYILSIAEGRDVWPVYPFIKDIKEKEPKNGYAVLTQDVKSDAKGKWQVNLWVVSFEDICDQIDKGFIKLQFRASAKPYYRVDMKILNGLVKPEQVELSEIPKILLNIKAGGTK